MTSKTQKIMKTVSILTTLGSFAAVGLKLYREFKKKDNSSLEESKLDNRLESSMDCSDATAVY